MMLKPLTDYIDRNHLNVNNRIDSLEGRLFLITKLKNQFALKKQYGQMTAYEYEGLINTLNLIHQELKLNWLIYSNAKLQKETV